MSGSETGRCGQRTGQVISSSAVLSNRVDVEMPGQANQHVILEHLPSHSQHECFPHGWDDRMPSDI